MARNLKSRNFRTHEVIYRPSELPASLDPAAYFFQGVLQVVRDYLTIKFKREVRIDMISGYRPSSVNSATPGAAENSNHIWSLEGESFKVAGDITSPDIPIMALYDACRILIRGEVYVDIPQKKVHVAPCGPIKTPWIQ